jgi:hypothetical protein
MNWDKVIYPYSWGRLMYRGDIGTSMVDEESETVSMKVHVPRWQKDEWVTHADQLDMTQSEFLRSMIQAGRLNIGQSRTDEIGSPDATPGGDDLEERVLDVLRGSGYLTWDDILAGVMDDIEERLEDALDAHQKDNRIQYSGRNGGYTVTVGGDDGS